MTANGNALLELIYSVMDIQMPKMDGLVATRSIRQWEASHTLGHTPIVALTASVLEDDVQAALAAGCDLHLNKPIKKLILLQAMRRATPLLTAHTVAAAHTAETNGAGMATRAKPRTRYGN